MKPKSSTSPAQAGPIRSGDAAYARWARLLRNPHFAAPTDLPPGPRTRQWLSRETVLTPEQEQFSKKWEETTPQGREIIRKKLHAFKMRMLAKQQEAAGGG